MDGVERATGIPMPTMILGTGGHARVIADALLPQSSVMVEPDSQTNLPPNYAAIGIGDIKKRQALFEKYGAVMVIHPKAVIAHSARIGWGAQIMAGAIVQANAVIGDNVLINTNASVDHDCIIGPHCHIAPGAVLCGYVNIGEGSFIGAGAIIVQGVQLEPGSFIPAGSLVVSQKQDDIRRPTRVVRDDRADQAATGP